MFSLYDLNEVQLRSMLPSATVNHKPYKTI